MPRPVSSSSNTWYNEQAQRELRVYALESGSVRVVFARDDVENPQPFAWTPDGSQVLAVLARADRTSEIALVGVATAQRAC